MRTVFVGNRALSRHLLRHALDTGWDVVGAVVPKGEMATQQANFEPVDDIVAGTDCELIETTDINGESTISRLDELDPDLCICGGWSEILRERTLDIPDAGFIGFHSSQLPEGRGGAPANWSIIDGQDDVWLSMFYYTTGVDAGDVIDQRCVPIEPRDTVGTVYDRLTVAACDALDETRDDLERGTVEATPQDISKATYRPRRQPQDGLLDWSMSSEQVFDWVRAQTKPYPGAYTFYNGTLLRLWECEILDEESVEDSPGTVLDVVPGSGFDVATGNGAVRVTRVKPEDGPSRWADEFADATNLFQGTRLAWSEAPAEWVQTGIRPPHNGKPSDFETNLPSGEQGAVDLLVRTGRERTARVVVELDGERVFDASTVVSGEQEWRVDFEPSAVGTHTLRASFEIDGDQFDTRYLKTFVS